MAVGAHSTDHCLVPGVRLSSIASGIKGQNDRILSLSNSLVVIRPVSLQSPHLPLPRCWWEDGIYSPAVDTF